MNEMIYDLYNFIWVLSIGDTWYLFLQFSSQNVNKKFVLMKKWSPDWELGMIDAATLTVN